MTKKIVITGATSFLGSSVVEGLVNNDYEVYSIVRSNSLNLKNLPIHKNNHIIYEDLKFISNIENFIEKADVFIHFGWDGIGSEGRSSRHIQDTNVENSIKALEVAKKLGCHTFIFSGSQAEYGFQKEIITEESECCPVSEYGKAKLRFGEIAEKYCTENEIRLFHLRIFSVYGLKDHPWTLINSCIEAFEAGKEIPLGSCNQYWNYMYITDFVDVFLKLIESKVTGCHILNVASDDTRKLREYVEEIYKNTMKRGTYLYGARGENAEGAAHLRPDVNKIKTLIGWEPKVSFTEGIRYIIEQKREKKYE